MDDLKYQIFINQLRKIVVSILPPTPMEYLSNVSER